MTPVRLAHVEAPRADGRWAAPYAGSAAMVIPQDVPDALDAMPAAKSFFATLDRKNLFAIHYRLRRQSARRRG